MDLRAVSLDVVPEAVSNASAKVGIRRTVSGPRPHNPSTLRSDPLLAAQHKALQDRINAIVRARDETSKTYKAASSDKRALLMKMSKLNFELAQLRVQQKHLL